MERAAHLCSAVERGREGNGRMKYRKRGKTKRDTTKGTRVESRASEGDDKGKSNLPKATQQHQEFITASQLKQ